MAIARLPCAYSFAVPGAAGHNRGEVAERQALARTQGRNLDRGLNLKPTPCVGCLLTPERKTSGLKGTVPRNRQTLLSARCSRSMRQDVWSTGHSCHVAHGARNTTDPRTDQRPTRANRARSPRRATIPRTGGQRPKDRQAVATL